MFVCPAVINLEAERRPTLGFLALIKTDADIPGAGDSALPFCVEAPNLNHLHRVDVVVTVLGHDLTDFGHLCGESQGGGRRSDGFP